ncbi:MAG TPA: DNA glycosylase [Nitrososphaerales archaeon]|nr:DNA glycosylase [Nitrososphaerales archaeon]
MEFVLGLESPFSLDYTLESGQVFRWENRGEWWYGVLPMGVIKVKQEADSIRCVSSSESMDGAFVRSYFRLDEQLEPILASIMKDSTMASAVQRFYGLRLIRQEFWECLASFLLATNANIPRIKKMVSSVCSTFGDPTEFEGLKYFRFPPPERLAEAQVAELRECGLGYRAPFLRRVAESVSSGAVDGGEIELKNYEQAHSALLKVFSGEKLLLGVGPKVADCVLLYSCGKDDAFPIDVWVARELADSYPRLVDPSVLKKLSREHGGKLTYREYADLSRAARGYFGPYSGYAQQYLYMYGRVRDQ